jgi:hypothetical protein
MIYLCSVVVGIGQEMSFPQCSSDHMRGSKYVPLCIRSLFMSTNQLIVRHKVAGILRKRSVRIPSCRVQANMFCETVAIVSDVLLVETSLLRSKNN